MLATIIPSSALKWNSTNTSLAAFMKEKVKGDCEPRRVTLIQRETMSTEQEVRLWHCPYAGGIPDRFVFGLRNRSHLFLIQFEYGGKEVPAELAREAAEIVQSITVIDNGK